MVRFWGILLFMLTVVSFQAQRINATFSGGWTVGKSNTTIFDEAPFQFLYAAPYYSAAIDEYDQSPPFDQVRLVQIYGATPYTRANFSLNGGLQYQALNHWRFGVNVGVFRDQDDIYYGFQNMVINGSAGQNSVDVYSPELLDEFISISRWMSNYEFEASYEFNSKSKFKPEIIAGYLYKLQFYSTYSSNLLDNESTYLQDEDQEYVQEYYNTKVFQDRLYQELANDGLNHYAKIGLGVKYYSAHLRFEWMRSITNSTRNYYLANNFFNIKLSYDLVSIPLFK